jgi:hypothetical protein
MSGQLVKKFKRVVPSRAELTMNRASQRATSISSSPSRDYPKGVWFIFHVVQACHTMSPVVDVLGSQSAALGKSFHFGLSRVQSSRSGGGWAHRHGPTRLQGWSARAFSTIWKFRPFNIPSIYIYIVVLFGTLSLLRAFAQSAAPVWLAGCGPTYQLIRACAIRAGFRTSSTRLGWSEFELAY